MNEQANGAGLHNLLICCGSIPPGGTPGCCYGRWGTCWCGGRVDLRVPGDSGGMGCLEDITHSWREEE